ncbi:DinB family protein [Candidatus Bathyarchaeota archaeon]|nr:DinB family protein [Candidatus Bathyarchaeota archaeon]MBS7631040.1 DinB family protein [Candidatus Bathyarchaeota archaeon]
MKESEIDWRPVPEANNIRWILTHLSQQWNVGFPRMFKGDPSYKPSNWPDDYVGSLKISLSEILDDLIKGKETVLQGLSQLKEEDLDVDIPLWGGTRKRSFGLMAYLSEIVHHEGQIAYLRGTIGRMRQSNPNFLL